MTKADCISIKKLLLSDPLLLLVANEASYRSYAEKVRQNYSEPILHNYLKKLAIKTPLFLLLECIEDACVLNRLYSPEPRAFFERKVVETLVEKSFANKNKAINYLSIGAGNLFQDFVIISQAAQQGMSTINVFLVDLLYKELKKKTAFTAKAVLMRERFKQFSQWFSYAYPQIKMKLFIYGTINEYIKRVKLIPDMLADIYIGADLETKKKNGFEIYSALPYEKVLKNDGIGFLLHKGKLKSFSTIWQCLKILPKNNNNQEKSNLLQKSIVDQGRSILVMRQGKKL